MKQHEESAPRAMHADGKSVAEMSRVCKVTCETIERRLRSIGLPATDKPRAKPINYVTKVALAKDAEADEQVTQWSKPDVLLRRFSFETEGDTVRRVERRP